MNFTCTSGSTIGLLERVLKSFSRRLQHKQKNFLNPAVSYFHNVKTRRIIYIILGILFIFLDVIATLVNINHIITQATPDGYGVGYVIGSQIFLYIGLLFFYGSHRVAKS